jgi:hypothetical protein
MKIPLILRKIFKSMAANSGSLPLKVGEFTCMPGSNPGKGIFSFTLFYD